MSTTEGSVDRKGWTWRDRNVYIISQYRKSGRILVVVARIHDRVKGQKIVLWLN